MIKFTSGIILILIGAAICLIFATWSLNKKGMKLKGTIIFSPMAFFFGVFMAHLFYCLMRFEYALYDMDTGYFRGFAFLHFWDGNYMLYGGAFGVILALIITSHLGNMKPLRAMDIVAPWGALMIAFVRLGQGIDGNFYGLEIDEEAYSGVFAAMFDDYYEVWHWSLFIPAAVVALIVFVILLQNKGKKDGDSVLLLSASYACAQIILETLRRDEVLRWGFVRCSQVISLFIAVFVLFCYWKRANKQKLVLRIVSVLLFFISILIAFIMEFAQEQRIASLLFLSSQNCYTISAGCCAIMLLCIIIVRSIGLTQDTV